MSPIIDIHTHCAPRTRDDPFEVAAQLRGTPVGRNVLVNYRGLPAIGYYEFSDLELQQEACAKAGISGRLMSTPFTAEIITAISHRPALDVVKHGNDQIAALIARTPATAIPRLWGLGTVNPLDRSQIAEGERCMGPLGFKGLLINTSWHGRFIDGDEAFPFRMGRGPAGAAVHASGARPHRARAADGPVQA
jgi:predicted TIM-barrel fold metal-dependent hydrolase